ncbi:MAG TPA: OmpA family protein [Thermoanaerobaculia bacterium]|nr:OmpA family protein [Thermoanaerobaculia bacterium]
MKKSRILATILILTLIALLPACKTTRKKPEELKQPAMEEPQPPVVEPPPAETVKPVEDFVKTDPEPAEEVLPADMDLLNQVVQEKGYIRDAYFNYDEATLDADAQAALSTSAAWLKGRDGTTYNVLIEGHCDERGTEQYNLALGDRRANTARDYLVTLGVDARRIRTVSYGEERPFDEGHHDGAWAKNRVAHLVLVR